MTPIAIGARGVCERQDPGRLGRLTGGARPLHRPAALYKLGLETQRCWRQLNGAQKIAKLIAGTRFVDGIEIAQNQHAA
jgi:hypothetical protein